MWITYAGFINPSVSLATDSSLYESLRLLLRKTHLPLGKGGKSGAYISPPCLKEGGPFVRMVGGFNFTKRW